MVGGKIAIRVLNISRQKKWGRVERASVNGVERWAVAPYDLGGVAKGISSFSPDIVHIHGIMPPFHVPFLLKKLRKASFKTVYTVHGVATRERLSFPVNMLAPTIFQKQLLQQVTYIVAISEDTRQIVMVDYGVQADKISVITHGVGKEFFEQVPPIPLKNYPGIQDRQVLLFVGGVKWVKGLDFLLESLERFTRDDWVLLMAGRRLSYDAQLRRRFSRLFDLQKVIALGALNQQQLVAAYTTASICILPSRYDSFGLVGLEAMAAGKPVIVSDRVGMRFLIKSGHNGFITHFGDIEQLTALLYQLLDDEKLRNEVGRNAQITARQETWPSKASAYLDLYHRLASNSIEAW
jgi:D-inositol-3-phosphate glycosyltransferase